MTVRDEELRDPALVVTPGSVQTVKIGAGGDGGRKSSVDPWLAALASRYSVWGGRKLKRARPTKWAAVRERVMVLRRWRRLRERDEAAS